MLQKRRERYHLYERRKITGQDIARAWGWSPGWFAAGLVGLLLFFAYKQHEKDVTQERARRQVEALQKNGEVIRSLTDSMLRSQEIIDAAEERRAREALEREAALEQLPGR